MSHQKNSSNDKSSDEKSISESDYLASILNLLNGHCKVNFVVPQISSFYTSDSLLPINAKVNTSTLNNKEYNEICNAPTPDSIANMLKNVIRLKSDEINEDLDDKQFHSFDNNVDEFQVYSKPYSDNSNHMGKHEDKKINVSPRTKKKKNKINNITSTSDNQITVPSTHEQKEQNVSIGYIDPYEIARLNDGLHFKQEQELLNKLMKNAKNNINVVNVNLSRSQSSLMKQNPENEIQYDNTPLVSQCPLCFGLYPTSDIEAHASECSI